VRHRTCRPTLRVERLEDRKLLAAVDSLRFAEIMYHPAEPANGPFVEDDFEFIELVNTAPDPINLANVKLQNAVTFNFAGSPVQSLAGGARALIVKNVAAFESRYGGGRPVAGVFGGTLANGSDTLELFDAGAPVQNVAYDDAWRPVTDGDGFSLTVVDPAAPPAMWNNAANYRGSLRGGGSPGSVEAPLNAGDIVINEVLAHTDVDPGDWIELHNVTEQAINISDWYLSDKGTELNRYRIADDAFIPAGGYLTFTQQDDFDDEGDPGALVPFGLSEHGEAVFLSSWDSNGLNAVYEESQSFRASDREVTFGRYRNSVGEWMFVEQSVSSFNAPNAAPLVGPVVISEIMYNQAGAGSEHEFIELYNTSATAINLFDPLHPENTWKFTNGIDFVFPAGVTIPANGFLVISSVDPAAFRAANNVPTEVQVFGPWLGGLDKNGESLSLSRPGEPELIDGFVPYYRADHVNYDDTAPWPTAPDGNGPSLVRKAMNLFGNDPASWQASAEMGGTPGRPSGTVTLPGDTNGDGQVNVVDLNNVRNNFGAEGEGVLGDTDGNNRVDVSDLNAVRNNFGASLPNPSPAAEMLQTSTNSHDRRGAARRTLSSQHAAAINELLLEWHADFDRAAKRNRDLRRR
jgi:hypothetical protein